MREAQFQAKVIQWFKNQGAYVINQWGGPYTRAGIPDLTICYEGTFIALELKTETGKPTELQLYHIREINKAGGYARILRPSEFEEFKKEVIRGAILS